MTPKDNRAPQPQRILIFQQNGSGANKVAGLRKYGGESLALENVPIDQALPAVIENTAGYFPENFQADLVLDFLKHPDLSHDLALICTRRHIPIIASGKKTTVKGAHTPPTWCSLSRQVGLGQYGKKFGVPDFEVELEQGRIARIGVRRGAPCGATWEAAARVANLPADEALACIGLQTQYFCAADPAGWDPITGKSPVHLAGDIHRKALIRGLKKSCGG